MIPHRMNMPSALILLQMMDEARREADRMRELRSPIGKLPRPDVIILDMDGTLVRHKRPGGLKLLEALQTAGNWVTRLRAPRRRPGATSAARPPRLYGHRLLHRLRRRDVRRIVEPAPGVEDFLLAMKHAGIPVALVSNGLGRNYGHDVLAAYDLVGYFAVTVFREDVRRPKPDPESLLKALDRLDALAGAPPQTIWCIGDQLKDMEAVVASRERMTRIWVAVLYCTAEPSFSARGNADHVFADWATLETHTLHG